MGNVLGIQISCDALFNGCTNCTRRNAAYVSQLEDNLANLKTQLQKLIEAKDDVMTRVANAEQHQMRRLNKVQGWLSRVESVEAEVGELIRHSTQEIDKLCLGGYCSKNCQSSYNFGKKVSKKLQLMDTLMGEGAFDVVAEKVPQPAVDERPLEPTIVGLDSTFDKVWRCLIQEQVGIIGLHGMGGVGKTTLLTQINNKFLDAPNNFEVVIWVVVSKDMQLESVQEKIGERIGFLENRSLEEKASGIFKILSKKKFLLLLDDIWERVDLAKLGVPFPAISKNASKIVFTTRLENVCGLMEAQKKFKVECLGDNEAWELFLQKVGEETLGSHPDILELAKTVAKECCGLPLALITTGRAMSGKKTPEEWNYAIEMLRRSASEFPGMEKEVYPLLKFSFDSLSSDVLRFCLLYCSLFPEDYHIGKIELIECWIGEGFLNGYEGINGVHNKGYYIIGVLFQACLLEEVGSDYVKMHDVIRDMALWIACEVEKENENFLVSAGVELTKPPEKIPRQLLCSFSGLEVLRMLDCGYSRKIAEDSVQFGGSEILVEELITLEHLNVLSVTLKSFGALQRLLSCQQLHSSTRALEVRRCEDSKSWNILSIADLKYVDKLDFAYSCCSRLREVTWLVFAPNLKIVHIESCYDMDEIISAWKLGEVPGLNPFAKLQYLRLQVLTKLKIIFRNALPFPNLLELFVSECPNLKKLPLDINSAKEGKTVIRGDQHWWNELKWEDEATLNAFLPCFESI
ncbi:putative disease resistance protein [Citrus sinensis]|uniref:Disease resistance protein n=1 Tax=Citrus sinensis TaxID=2711 RepID=A0ACB8JBQ5_CITSI|nr:putative disease resistance protein [Citrus sinensis]